MHALQQTVDPRRHRQGLSHPGGDRADRDGAPARVGGRTPHDLDARADGRADRPGARAGASSLGSAAGPVQHRDGRAHRPRRLRRRRHPRLRITGRRRRRTMRLRARDPPKPTQHGARASELVNVPAADLVDRGAPDHRPHARGTRRRPMDVASHGARDRRALAGAGAGVGARSRPLARSFSPHRSGLHADGVGHPASVRADAGGRRQLAR